MYHQQTNRQGQHKGSQKKIALFPTYHFIRLLSVILAAAFCLNGCAASAPLTQSAYLLDTVVTLTLYDGGNQETLPGAMAVVEYYHNLWNKADSKSDICRINEGAGQSVAVDPETSRLLQEALFYHELSQGAFAVTIGSVSRLWDFTGDAPIIPDKAALSQALKHVDDASLLVEEGAVTLTDPQSAIDVGGIAKGYIADRLKEYLVREGVKGAVINLGGNVYALGSKKGKDFQVGVQSPFASDGVFAATVAARDKSLVTSGVYQRYFEQNGRLYHHILSPENGMPVESELASVTILSESSCAGDALSTACFVLGEEKSRELLAGLAGVDALFVYKDGRVSATEGVTYR